MEKVVFAKYTLEYFDRLVFTLFLEGYFSFEESAQNYVDKIISFIVDEIDAFPHKRSPAKLEHFGSYYIFYKTTSRTTWYIFFERQKSSYLITGILNNYSREAAFI